MSDSLFTPIAIGGLTIKNRILMPAMHMNMCRNFQVSDRLIRFYRERAEGGAGAIIVGYATVDEYSGGPGNIGCHHDDHIPGLMRLAAVIKGGGARAGIQLNHAGRYNPSFHLGGKPAVAPSAVPSRLTRETPRELNVDEIAATIRRFAEAAGRAREAGFDLVEILAGTGYLISSFLSPLTNRREDRYGGSLENRMRFGLEVLAAVKARLSGEIPVIVRVNGNDFMEGGIGRPEQQAFAAALAAAGADAVSINVGWHEAQVPQIVAKVPRGVFAYMAREIKKQVAVPVMAGHRINDPQTARRLIDEGFCDLVAVGRALIADPRFPEKAAAGHDDRIVHCVACGQGCFDHIFKNKAVECLCNPRAGHEEEELEPAAVPQKVMVVGGGPAGMFAALAAAERGHRVTLHEGGLRLGGQLHLAGRPPGRSEFLVLADDLERQLAVSGVEIRMNSTVDRRLLELERPEVLILATGGEPIVPPIPGVDLPLVVQAWDILAGNRQAGRKVAVLGGGAVGVETALYLAEEGSLSGDELKFLLVHGAEQPGELYRLATEHDREIALVEMTGSLGANFGKTTRWGMLQDVERYGIKPLVGARVVEITPAGLRFERGGQIIDLSVDTVVLAVGTRARNPLRQVAEELGLRCVAAGDAVTPGTVFEASHQGWQAGRTI
ncbi:MAG: oxidoreductase [Desulfoprunum sp.]